jgi:GNAT superfamily N-acetyltransferase
MPTNPTTRLNRFSKSWAGLTLYSVPIQIRLTTAADLPAIGRVRRETWFAAYSEILDQDIIDRVTATGGANADRPAHLRSYVAVAPAQDSMPVVVGYAACGPERAVDSAHPASSLTSAGRAGETGELYAIYVAPDWWSTGAGRALLSTVLAALRSAGYRRVTLWTLTDNARARRFYEKAAFVPDGATNILARLGGVEELRYVRDL